MTDTNQDRFEEIKEQGLYALTLENYCWLIQEVERLRNWIAQYKKMSEGDYQLKKIDSLTKERDELKVRAEQWE